jgi:serine/threonine-protein kinase
MAGRRIRCPNCHTIQRVPRTGTQVLDCLDLETESANLTDPMLAEDTALLELERLLTRPQFEIRTETSSGATFRPGEGPAALLAVAGYVIERELGRGAVGVVYQARDLKRARAVAIKVMLAGAQGRPEEVARFRTETLAVAGMDHPGLVRVFDVGEQDGVPYCIMEYIEGGNLRQHLRGKPLPPREATLLAALLAGALATVHKARVIHRDLKPENILVGTDGIPRIADFGLARKLDGGERLTHHGQVFGTPCYMAPEQAAGRIQDVGPLADVYALGAILYEMLTGSPPFEGPTDAQTLAQILTQEPLAPRRLDPRIPRDLETICLRCLQKEPHRRYAGAAELAADLYRVLDDKPIQARPVGRFEQFWWWCRRKPLRAVLTAVIAGLLTVLAIGGPLEAYRLGRQNAELRQRLERMEQPEKATPEHGVRH